jgi:DNA-binding FadR family transcriptional regulator
MQTPAPRIQRTTLAEQVESHLRELIVSDALGAGAVLPSSIDLASEFGVSRSIVREAMKSLQAKGLIEIANGKRARVRPITNSVLIDFFHRFSQSHTEAVIELLELRRGIEVQSAYLAAQRRTEPQMAEMLACIARMEAAIGKPDDFLDADVQLHLAIAAASGNSMIFHLVDSVREVVRDTVREGLIRHADLATWQANQAGHVRLVGFIAKQDADGAAASMADHFDDAIRGIRTRPPQLGERQAKRVQSISAVKA